MSDDTPPTTPEPEVTPPAEGSLEARTIEVLKTIHDPEIPVNIYELGLVYDVDVDEAAGTVHVRMTLTSPACPVAGSLPGEVETKIAALDGVRDVFVELVWDPPWTMDKLSEAARLQLRLP
jgi:FeS assembly SUF system protein